MLSVLEKSYRSHDFNRTSFQGGSLFKKLSKWHCWGNGEGAGKEEELGANKGFLENFSRTRTKENRIKQQLRKAEALRVRVRLRKQPFS